MCHDLIALLYPFNKWNHPDSLATTGPGHGALAVVLASSSSDLLGTPITRTPFKLAPGLTGFVLPATLMVPEKFLSTLRLKVTSRKVDLRK